MTLNVKKLLSALKAYQRKQDGSLSIETAMVVPVMLTLLMFCYTYFTAFETKSRANKAADAVSDYVSRQTNPIDQTFVDGMGLTYRFLTNSSVSGVRVSAVTWATQANGEGAYQLDWSAGHGNIAVLEDVTTIQDRLPILSTGEQVVIVETHRPWTPLFSVGLGAISFRDFMPVKPRFAAQVVFDGPVNETTESIAHDLAPLDEDVLEDFIEYDEEGEEVFQDQ